MVVLLYFSPFLRSSLYHWFSAILLCVPFPYVCLQCLGSTEHLWSVSLYFLQTWKKFYYYFFLLFFPMSISFPSSSLITDMFAAAAAKSLQLCPTLRPHRRQPTRLPSLGFSRQEHWSGLPLPSPMHESEKWKGSHSVMSNS